MARGCVGEEINEPALLPEALVMCVLHGTRAGHDVCRQATSSGPEWELHRLLGHGENPESKARRVY